MASRIRIYNRDGTQKAEIDAIVQRSWVFPEVGQAMARIALTDPKVIEDNFTEGNLIFVEHDKLPAWGGVMDDPQNWYANYLEQTCFSGEWLLRYRVAPRNRLLTGDPGGIFEQIVQIANEQDDARIRIGEVWRGGGNHNVELKFDNLYEVLMRLVELTKYEFEFTPKLDAGNKLYFEANWYERRGVTSPVWLIEGHNLQLEGGVIMSRQGPIINSWTGFGDGASWDARAYVTYQDADSISKYGLRQESAYVSSKILSAVDVATKAKLDDALEPKRLFAFTAVDVGETFYHLRPGNTLGVSLKRTGFKNGGLGLDTSARIIAMEYSDFSDGVKLTVEEVV